MLKKVLWRNSKTVQRDVNVGQNKLERFAVTKTRRAKYPKAEERKKVSILTFLLSRERREELLLERLAEAAELMLQAARLVTKHAAGVGEVQCALGVGQAEDGPEGGLHARVGHTACRAHRQRVANEQRVWCSHGSRLQSLRLLRLQLRLLLCRRVSRLRRLLICLSWCRSWCMCWCRGAVVEGQRDHRRRLRRGQRRNQRHQHGALVGHALDDDLLNCGGQHVPRVGILAQVLDGFDDWRKNNLAVGPTERAQDVGTRFAVKGNGARQNGVPQKLDCDRRAEAKAQAVAHVWHRHGQQVVHKRLLVAPEEGLQEVVDVR
eukprot:m.41787 g.41787  ORF g.41787 m.41787 type:complete len:320 (+) comp12043_c0_seq1:2902-3861(+)